jgi:hypothetical protein
MPKSLGGQSTFNFTELIQGRSGRENLHDYFNFKAQRTGGQNIGDSF